MASTFAVWPVDLRHPYPKPAFERLAEFRDAALLDEALRAERDGMAAEFAAIRSQPLVRIARRVSRMVGRMRVRLGDRVGDAQRQLRRVAALREKPRRHLA